MLNEKFDIENNKESDFEIPSHASLPLVYDRKCAVFVTMPMNALDNGCQLNLHLLKQLLKKNSFYNSPNKNKQTM